MIFCPECGAARPVPTAGPRLRGLLLAGGGPPAGLDAKPFEPVEPVNDDDSHDDYEEEADEASAEPVNLFMLEDAEAAEPAAATEPVAACGFRLEAVAHRTASNVLALRLIDDATVLFPPGERVLQRYLVTVSASARGEKVAIDCPARAMLCADRLAGVLLGAERGEANTCFSLDLGSISAVALVREAKRFGGHRDLAVRLSTDGGDGFDVCLSMAAIEPTGPATYGPPPQALEPRALFNRLVGTTINSVRNRTGASDRWLDAAERGQLTPEGDDLVAHLRSPMR